MVRTATLQDTNTIRGIYNYYVLHTVATFEEEAISEDEMRGRVEAALDKFACLVFEENGEVIAYAYASQWKMRAAYKQTVELSVYVHPEHKGKGIGKQLYTALFPILKEKNIHSVIGGVLGDNSVSDKLHESFGFSKVARFKENGFKFGQWIDVTYWQLLL